MITSATNFLVGRAGINIQGVMVLTVRGRKSGQLRSLVVNPLEYNGSTYLFSPRGETQWAKNVRAVGIVSLHRGRNATSDKASEITDPVEKLAVIRAYLDRWSWQVKSLMGLDKSSSDDELRAVIDVHPVFVLSHS